MTCDGCGRPLTPRQHRGGRGQRWCSEHCRKGRCPLLPIGPFRQWINSLVAEHGVGTAAAMLDASERQLFRWRHTACMVRLDTVDRCLVAEGYTRLDDLYGDDVLEAV